MYWELDNFTMTLSETKKYIDNLVVICDNNCNKIISILQRNDVAKNNIIVYTSYLPLNSKLSERIYHIKCGLNEVQRCKVCDNEVKFKSLSKGYALYCSRKCTQSCSECRSKIVETHLQRYGKFNNNRIKAKETCIDKYGVENPSQVDEIKKTKTRRRTFDFYKSLFNSDRLKGKVIPLFSFDDYVNSKHLCYEFKCSVCNNVFTDNICNGRIPRCYNCNPITFNSQYELEILSWLKSLNINNIIGGSYNIIPPYQLDIYLPDYNIGIEFNGLWSHGELSNNKKSNYHITKTILCSKKGIDLLHIFEDEWILKKDIIKNILLNRLGLVSDKIYGRNCVIQKITSTDACEFLEQNHIQGAIHSKYNYGLYYKNNLVYMVSISSPRFNKNYEYELIRACSKLNTYVIGGFTKILKYVVAELNINSIISYVDRRYFTGKSYSSWEYSGCTKPSYFYTKNFKSRESRFKYQKHRLKTLYPKLYNKDLTEWDIMRLAGYDRVWDCGNLVFSLNLK